jgi:hypothetical protein
MSKAEAARRASRCASEGERIHRSHFCHWLSGHRVPTLEQAVALELLTSSWTAGPIRPVEWTAARTRAAA